jgi:hypothetical protein
VRRLRRILLNTATAASLLLCVATGVLWVRSYWRTEMFLSSGDDPAGTWSGFTGVGWSRGELFFQRIHLPPGYQDNSMDRLRRYGHLFYSFEVQPSGTELTAGLKPIQFESWQLQGAQTPCRRLAVKMWLPFACFAILPAARGARRVLRRRRAAPGVCVACGYDLRATPDRCPECGRASG